MPLIDSPICAADLEHIWCQLTPREKARLHGAKILITGCAGFLGFYTLVFFHKFFDQLSIKKSSASIIFGWDSLNGCLP